MTKLLAIPAALAGLTMLSGVAFAQTQVSATTDLNVRAGPGPNYPVVGVIGAGQGATIGGCVEGSRWCSVAFDGGEGWAYSDYLTVDAGGETVVLTERPATVEVPTVTYEETASTGGGAVAGAATGAVAGAIVGGPLGAAVGGVAGAATGGIAEAAIEPPARVRTYVESNVVERRVDPVYLDGEVVVGAGLPETVELREIPDYEYRYVYVNGQPVLVEPQTRRIVYIVR
ncbi:MAG: DUF1236 domain-containing protein [Rhizobiaceae bacterium]|nr:DUF1236 domain-containing protein [Rhizobiaceae bacterium]MCV0407674.1 DUF1236 domain-containing protein [Rhizobiaceae bacterium]